jgi:hypothetical protein
MLLCLYSELNTRTMEWKNTISIQVAFTRRGREVILIGNVIFFPYTYNILQSYTIP